MLMQFTILVRILYSTFVLCEVKAWPLFDPSYWNVVAVWQHEYGPHFLIYQSNNSLVKHQLPSDSSGLIGYCIIPFERKIDYEVDSVLDAEDIKGNPVELSSLSWITQLQSSLSSSNAMKLYYKELYSKLVLGEHKISYTSQNTVIFHWKGNIIILWDNNDNKLEVEERQPESADSTTNYVMFTSTSYEDSINFNTASVEKNTLKYRRNDDEKNQFHDELPLVSEHLRLLVSTNSETVYATWRTRYKQYIWMNFGELKINEETSSVHIENPKSLLMTHERMSIHERNMIMFDYCVVDELTSTDDDKNEQRDDLHFNKNEKKDTSKVSSLLLFITSIQPLRIVIALPKYKNQELMRPISTINRFEENNMNNNELYYAKPYLQHTVSLSGVKNFCWSFGEIIGGTPASLIENQYFGFFYSMKIERNEQQRNDHNSMGYNNNNVDKNLYFLGAYTFSRHPPFMITSISRLPISIRISDLSSPSHVSFSSSSDGHEQRQQQQQQESESHDDNIIHIVPLSFSFDKTNINVTFGYLNTDQDSLNSEQLYNTNNQGIGGGGGGGGGTIIQFNRTALFASLAPTESVVLGDTDWNEEGYPDVMSFDYVNLFEGGGLCKGPCEVA